MPMNASSQDFSNRRPRSIATLLVCLQLYASSFFLFLLLFAFCVLCARLPSRRRFTGHWKDFGDAALRRTPACSCGLSPPAHATPQTYLGYAGSVACGVCGFNGIG